MMYGIVFESSLFIQSVNNYNVCAMFLKLFLKMIGKITYHIKEPAVDNLYYLFPPGCTFL